MFAIIHIIIILFITYLSNNILKAQKDLVKRLQSQNTLIKKTSESTLLQHMDPYSICHKFISMCGYLKLITQIKETFMRTIELKPQYLYYESSIHNCSNCQSETVY